MRNGLSITSKGAGAVSSGQAVAADLSDRHVEDWDVIGGKLSLNEANSPSFRDFVQHSINRFFARGRGEPDLDLTVIGRHANQMNFGSELHNRKAMPERIVSSQRTKADFWNRPALRQLPGCPDATRQWHWTTPTEDQAPATCPPRWGRFFGTMSSAWSWRKGSLQSSECSVSFQRRRPQSYAARLKILQAAWPSSPRGY